MWAVCAVKAKGLCKFEYRQIQNPATIPIPEPGTIEFESYNLKLKYEFGSIEKVIQNFEYGRIKYYPENLFVLCVEIICILKFGVERFTVFAERFSVFLRTEKIHFINEKIQPKNSEKFCWMRDK